MEQRPLHPMVRELMTEYAALTGLSPASEAPRRYLWTDAFGVCNFLELYRQTGEDLYKDLPLLLVDQVHSVLGRHRADDSRTGWISGLDEEDGRMHPTKGGLRIGKPMRERGLSEPFDERLEWDRDGQYYHYLTKWMHALNRVGRVTGDTSYNIWAMGLAKTAHAKFTYGPPLGGQRRMYWKMAIDLSRPLVQSMGQHDPLDGYITYNQLQASIARSSDKSIPWDLNEEISDMARICRGKSWVTDDPLGIGGLLSDAYKVAQLIVTEDFKETDLLKTLLESSLVGLASYARMSPLGLPADHRLAFRELGLSIGMHGVEKLQALIKKKPGPFRKIHAIGAPLGALMEYTELIPLIENFWLDPRSREVDTWTDHGDINRVMLATSLAPDGFLTL